MLQFEIKRYTFLQINGAANEADARQMSRQMAKTDIENLIEWKKRRGRSPLTSQLSYELDNLWTAWIERPQGSNDFENYIPIRIVTIIEVFVREVIRDLVDYDQIYLERAETLSKGAKIDFTILLGLQGRKVSIGDLVAHTVSVNEPSRVIAYMCALIPDFVEKIRISHERWIEEEAEWPLLPIIENYDLMMAQLTRLFAVRHIVTHEMPEHPAFQTDEIELFFKAASQFLTATEWVVIEIQSNAIPRSQAAMNFKAGEDMRAAEEKMAELVKIIEARVDVDSDLFRESQNAWVAYAKKEADLRASAVTGGSMYPMIWAGAMREETLRRLETLKWWSEKGEYDL